MPGEIYDLIIVGGGPAGLMAAKTAAGEGLSVLLVERKKEISRITRSCCSMWINEPMTHGECISVENGRVLFRLNDFCIDYSGSMIPLRQYIRFSPGGKKVVFENRFDPVAIAFDKSELLKGLLSEAEVLGVNIASGSLCIDAEDEQEEISVKIRDAEGVRHLHGQYLILADGVNSALSAKLGFHENRKRLGRFEVISHFYRDVECPYPPAFMNFVGSGHLKGAMGNVYMLPKPGMEENAENVFEVSIGSPEGDRVSLKDKMNYFTREGYFASWFKNAGLVGVNSAVLNFRTPLATPAKSRTLVAGDAASFIETYCQGAIIYGRAAGLAVAARIKQGKDFSEYVDLWIKTYGYNQPGEIEKATKIYGINRLPDRDLDCLFGFTDNETWRGYVNEFNDFERMMKAINAHIDAIKAERPDLAAAVEKCFDIKNTELKGSLSLS